MAKKKTTSTQPLNDPLKTMKEPHPWRNIGMGFVIIGSLVTIIWGIGHYWADRQEQAKLEAIDRKMDEAATAIQGAVGSDFTIQKSKLCAQRNAGFSSWIECGTYREFVLPASISGRQQRAMLSQAFSSIHEEITFPNEDGSEDQTTFSKAIKFYFSDKECGGRYWRNERDAHVHYSISCISQATRIIPGYSYID